MGDLILKISVQSSAELIQITLHIVVLLALHHVVSGILEGTALGFKCLSIVLVWNARLLLVSLADR